LRSEQRISIFANSYRASGSHLANYVTLGTA